MASSLDFVEAAGIAGEPELGDPCMHVREANGEGIDVRNLSPGR